MSVTVHEVDFYGKHSVSPDRVHVSVLLTHRDSEAEVADLVSRLRASLPSQADTVVMPVVTSEPVAVLA